MRIVIDIQAYQSPYSKTRGVGRYTKDLIRALLERSRGHEIYLAMNGAYLATIESIRAEFFDLLPQDRFLVWQNHMKTQFSYNRELSPPKEELVRTAEVVREVLLNSVKPDIIFSPNMQEGFSDPAVTSVRRVRSSALYATTLHDLTPMHFEDELLSNEVVREWYLEKIEHAKTSDLIITDSHSAADDIVTMLDVDRKIVSAIHLGYDPRVFDSTETSRDISEDILKNLGIPNSFLFYFGGNDRCKNVERLLRAYSLLPVEIRTAYPLVLGGSSFKFDAYGKSHLEILQTIEALGITDNVIAPGFIDDLELPTVLKACTCFIFPSTHEGFGLPALEAMACGAPVIGSNRSSVGEVIGNKSALFDPYDVEDIAGKLEQVLTDEPFRENLRKTGLERAKAFSWSKAADTLLDRFEMAVAARKAVDGVYEGEPIRQAMIELAPYTRALNGSEMSDLARSLDETFPPGGPPTIYLDVSTVVSQDDRSGIQRVTRAIATGLIANPPIGYHVELVHSTADRQSFYAANRYKKFGLGFHAPTNDDYVAFKPGDILLFLDQAPRMAINHDAYTQYLRAIGVRVYFYVHDLIPLNHPEWFADGSVSEFRELMEVVSGSDGAICCSAATAADLKKFVEPRISSDRLPFYIASVHHGSDIKNTAPSKGLPSEADAVLQTIDAKISFLMIGTLEPRKGHRQTLEAFERLWASDIDVNLVIVGRWGWLMGDFDETLRNHPEWNRRLFWLSGISDEYLERIYGSCDCLIAASQAEGFGLPLVEAAHHKIPIIARDIPVFREVAGHHAHYFPDDSSAADLSQVISEWIALSRNGTHTSSDMMRTLSWAESIDQIVDFLVHDRWQIKVPRDFFFQEVYHRA
ncbi:glycosyltransferase involved in cell wall biosynthesis [Sphingobium sp. B11D3B]|uniref:glycosyltransferase family 4 protein n=1 Tax=Sphingobium sp. B11D3B TaxID=2940575 RepID=UPI0022274C1B|nr:glycosyltransferase family 1 protein [Sphingobium sp. B11D3B]MCW2387634.1 glycosyltransferase involved in cell wall biosynthesis [Sphingobium sp. B11D3B]